MATASALARTNIALVKYWGKADTKKNLSATGSISMTLSGFWTVTHVAFDDAHEEDRIVFNNAAPGENERKRFVRFLDTVREMAGGSSRASVVSKNNFPTAGGLASSASGFAAFADAAARAAGLDLAIDRLAYLARLGSGSAPRSLLGGVVRLGRGDPASPEKCDLRQLAAPDKWDLRLVIALAGSGAKKTGSTDGMERSRLTSPYYPAWIDTHDLDMERARRAIEEKDFTALGTVAESSCIKMHAAAMASSPPVFYWKPATVAAMNKVWELRAEGLEAYFTIDAGPHVKVLCMPADSAAVAAGMAEVPGIEKVFVERPGPGIERL